MKKFLLVSLAAFFCFAGKAQRPDSVQRFVDSAINIMQQHSMFSSNVNWKTVRDSVHHLTKEAKTYAETATALHYAFNKLGDKHGYLVIDGKAYRNTTFGSAPSRINENMKVAASKGARIYKDIVDGDIAYLSIPFFNNQTKAGTNAFAQQLQDSLCSVVSPKTKGIIIDLRLNAGGFTQAMIVGVSNVFGNQTPPVQKSYVGDWKIENYGIDLNDTFRIQLQKTCGEYTKLPVAVLIGPQTASAGEYLALGFTTRSRTILIGEKTAGYTSGNNGFLLPGKSNGIVVAEDYATDKNGKVYTDGVEPELAVFGGDDFFNRPNDKKIRTAVKWLRRQ
ncbi:MAG: hypothetical protein EOO10_12950 [Chitinophagaceae bacterium]|nr:MAG: hypothetical protein EOO10_12950 [Chitinophagaceae bacterium]